MPYWATLLAIVRGPKDEAPDAPVDWQVKLLDDLSKAFQGFLDRLQWRELRHFVSVVFDSSVYWT